MLLHERNTITASRKNDFYQSIFRGQWQIKIEKVESGH